MAAQCDKDWATKHSLIRLGSRVNQPVPSIVTGMPSLDREVLGCGGIPRGRIIEILGPNSSGKTTIALAIIAAEQKDGGLAAYVDAEHTLDPSYAQKLGADVDNLLVSQPDYGEQALGIVEALVRSGLVSVIVIDSVAALVPKAELDGDMGDSHMGLHARLMSQAMRKLNGVAEKSGTTLIFINQIREKIGVMFGCFHYNSRVLLADGSQMKIGKIVNQRIPADVVAYDRKSNTFSTKRIVNWFDNGNAAEFLQVTAERAGSCGKHQLACTPNHKLLTPTGYRAAGDLVRGDYVVTRVRHYLTHELEQAVIGSALGDGSIRKVYLNTATLRIGHGAAQDAYCTWKHSLFGEFSNKLSRNSKGGLSFDTAPSYELSVLKGLTYAGNKKNLARALVKNLSPLAIAIWYMDDGTFDSKRLNRSSICCKGLSDTNREELQARFKELGIMCTHNKQGRLDFGVKSTKLLHEMIAPFVHPSMDYKLMPSERGKFSFRCAPFETYQPIPMKIVSIKRKPATRSMRRFDIEIADKHNYVVDGVVVHNSPETTTGGRALQFYASIRLDIRRRTALKNGDDEIGFQMEVKAIKNKCGSPKKSTILDLYYPGESDIIGFDKGSDLLDFAVKNEVVEKAGAWYSFKMERIGQGRVNAAAFLNERPDFKQAILEAVDKKIESEKKAEEKK